MHVVLSPSESEDLFRTPGGGGWDRFYERYPDSPGIITLSLPGLSADGTVAAIHLADQRHGLAGAGKICVYRKMNAMWVKDDFEIYLWVS